MKLFYNTATGNIIQALKNQDVFWQEDSINVAYSILEIDELSPDNKALCIDIIKTQGKRNSEGEPKYFVSSGELYETDNWEEEDIWDR